MIKICLITSAFGRQDNRLFWKQCRSLVKEGYDVTLITCDNKENEIIDGVKITTSGFYSENRIRRILFSKKYLYKKAMASGADIYQIQDPELIPIGLKLLKKRKSVVYDSREDLPQLILEKEWIPKFIRRSISFLAENYLKLNLKKFDAVISVTPNLVDKLKENAQNVFLVTNYPLIEDEHNIDSFENYNLRENRLCYAGTVYRISLQENILQSIEGIEDIKYYIVGSMDESYKENLKEKSSWNKVILIDTVPRPVLLEIYRSVTIGIAIFDYTPNLGFKKGSLGVIKMFEYMQSALPVICTDFDLWKEIIDKHKCGIYVDPHNINEITDAIKYLIENKSEAFAMGQNGRKAVISEYNWDIQGKEYLKIYNNIMTKRLKDGGN